MADRPSTWQNRLNWALLVACVLLGFLLTLQLRSPAAGRSFQEQDSERIASTIQQLEVDQKELKYTVSDLRTQIDNYRHQTAASSTIGIEEELERQRMAAGLVPLSGPGIIVTLDDSTKAVGPGDDPANYLIHDYEVRDIVNLLWLAGAEAISVNGERLVNSTSLYCVGSTILCNNTRLSPPYEIRAIGVPASLEEPLRNPANLQKLKSRTKLFGIQFEFITIKETTIPAYNGSFALRYAVPNTAGK
jgi:uncharacterized protein YlxW (UPF0749 family)